MEKDIDRIQKSGDTEIIIRIDDFGGRRGVTIREFVKSERYTGFTKAGTRIPADKFSIFKAAINSIDEKDLEGAAEQSSLPSSSPSSSSSAPLSASAIPEKSFSKPEKKKKVEIADDEMAM